MIELKTCSKCGIEKDVELFWAGHRQCSECLNKYRRENREKNREKANAWQKKYREENREKLIAMDRKYREENREKAKAASIKWRKENPERVKAIDRKAREKNREKRLTYNRKWRSENPDKAKSATLRWRKENIEKISMRRIKRDHELHSTDLACRIAKNTNLKKAEIPPELIEIYRLKIQLQRGIKNGTSNKND